MLRFQTVDDETKPCLTLAIRLMTGFMRLSMSICPYIRFRKGYRCFYDDSERCLTLGYKLMTFVSQTRAQFVQIKLL